MNLQPLLLPLFARIALTFLVLFGLIFLRIQAIKNGEVRFAQIALGPSAWPETVIKVGNCFNNQLQMPVLFYVLVVLVGMTNKTDFTLTVLAWIFVVLRVLHALEEIGRNNVKKRFYSFFASTIVLLVMWIEFMVRIV